jgi:hypothetical protein
MGVCYVNGIVDLPILNLTAYTSMVGNTTLATQYVG